MRKGRSKARRQKAQGRRQTRHRASLWLPSAFCLLPSLLSSLIPRRKFKLCEERGCGFGSLRPPSGDLSEHSALRAAMMSYPDSSLFNQPVEHPSGVLREERLEDELALAHPQAQSQFARSPRQVRACQDHPASHGREKRLQELIKRLL